MQFYEKKLRAGIAALLCAAGLRLTSGALPEYLLRPRTAAFLLYLQTGRNVRAFAENMEYPVDFLESAPAAPRETTPPVTQSVTLPPVTLPPVTEPSPTEEPEVPAVSYACDLRPDLRELLERPLKLGQVEEAPAVLILSTHATESYRYTGEDYRESSAYRTLNPEYNMISIGSCVARLLEQRGIPVVQDRTFHDYPSYNGSYTHARKSILSHLKEYPSVQLILDLHRDATDGSQGQLCTRASVDGKDSAQLMLVVGTDSGGLTHADWEENLSLALKLQVQLEALAPGITRPLSLRAQRFNQDLSPGALLVEVGAAGNTRQEALSAAEVLAEAVALLLEAGGVRTDSTS